MNLALHTEGKKKVNPLVIPGVCFTKLIINHLQSKHKFHKRPGSPLHLPYEESALGYLKFSFKNTKRRYLAGEVVSDDEAPATKPAKGAKPKITRKPKLQLPKTIPVAKPAPSKISKSTSSQPPKPKPTPAKPQEKKRKLVLDTAETPSQAKRSKAGKVSKKRKLQSTLQLVDEFVDEGVPMDEPRFGDEEADMRKAMEESLKDAYVAPRGPLPPVVIREPEPGKCEPLPEVQGKWKEKVGEEQAAQRCTPVPTVPSSHEEPSSLYVELGLTDSKTESDNEASREGQARSDPGKQVEDQAGSDPGKQVEGQAGSDPGVAVDSQIQPSHVVHAGPNLEHMNLEENLKLPTEEKSQEHEPEKTNTEVEVQSMVTVPIHQDTSSVPLMTSPIIDLIVSQPASTTIGELERCIADLVEENQTLEERLDKQGNRMHQLETQDLSRMIKEQIMEYMRTQEIDQKINETVKEAVTASVQYAMRAPLRARFKDLPTSDMKEIMLQRMLEENYDMGHEDHKMAYEALQQSILHDKSKQFDADKAEKLKKKKRKQDSPKTPPGSPLPPPPPPLPSGPSGASGTTGASDSAQDPLPPPSSPTTNQDIGSRHIPKVNLNQEWFKPLSEEERPATLEPAWSIPSSSLPVPINNWASVIASSYVPLSENSLLSQTGDIEGFIDWLCKKQGIIELTTEHLEVDDRLLRHNVSRPLPLGGPPGQVTIQTEFFFNKDLEYLRFGNKGDRLALSITKIKAAHYPDAGLKHMVPDQMWIEEEFMYDISATYGVCHWWFKRQKFYIDRHSADTNRRAIVRTHMRILSVIKIEVFLIYGYDYMKKIILRRADNQEYTIAENDFKDLYPSDFKDLYLLYLQGHLNHLPPRDKMILSTAVNLWIRNLVIRKRVEDFQLGIESYQTQLNLTKPRWEATDEALDYRVKEFKVNKNNPGLNTRFWTTNDVIKCKQFMFAIQKRLKLRRIFQNLESFVGGRIEEGDYRLLRRTE
ncbi:hypothetical protein Tco_1456943 [Tanacetum coccineum]